MQSNNFRSLHNIIAKKKKIQKIKNIFLRIANVCITSCYSILCNRSFHSSIKYFIENHILADMQFIYLKDLSKSKNFNIFYLQIFIL